MAKKNCVRVNVKLATRADRNASRVAMSAAPGVLNVTQTFPDETDSDLARLYLLDVEDAQLESALERLRSTPGVEYVEAAAPRKLIRGA